MVLQHPTLVTVASKDEEVAKKVQKIVSSGFFRIYTHNDVLGVEIAGALKNVLAIGAGIIEGSGMGYNTKAALVTRGSIVNFLLTFFFKFSYFKMFELMIGNEKICQFLWRYRLTDFYRVIWYW